MQAFDRAREKFDARDASWTAFYPLSFACQNAARFP
jgi:hypothetical protein